MATTGLISQSELATGRLQVLCIWSWGVFEERLERMKGVLAQRSKEIGKDAYSEWEVSASGKTGTKAPNAIPLVSNAPVATQQPMTPTPAVTDELAQLRKREQMLAAENAELRQALKAAREQSSLSPSKLTQPGNLNLETCIKRSQANMAALKELNSKLSEPVSSPIA